MKKVVFFSFMLLFMVASKFSNAQSQDMEAYQQGMLDGADLGQYVITAYIAPNLPPESKFVSVVQSNTVMTFAGTNYYVFDTIVGGIDHWAYAVAVTNYAYQYGILYFYKDYAIQTLTEAGMPQDYINGYLRGYLSRMKGRVVLPIGE